VWSSTKSVIQNLASVNLHNQTGPGKWADPDFLMTGGAGCDVNETGVRCPGQTENEYRSEMSLWTIGAAQIVVATDSREMTAFMKGVLLHEEMLAIHQDSLARPGGRIGYSPCGAQRGTQSNDPISSATCSLTSQISHSACTLEESFGCYDNSTMWIGSGCRGVFSCDGIDAVLCNATGPGNHTCKCTSDPNLPVVPTQCEIWARELSDGSMAVGLYNADITPHDITANISQVFQGFGAYRRTAAEASGAKIRDVWNRKELGTFSGKFTATAVGVHDTRVFRFIKAQGAGKGAE